MSRSAGVKAAQRANVWRLRDVSDAADEARTTYSYKRNQYQGEREAHDAACAHAYMKFRAAYEAFEARWSEAP